jgi:hypothetical protein
MDGKRTRELVFLALVFESHQEGFVPSAEDASDLIETALRIHPDPEEALAQAAAVLLRCYAHREYQLPLPGVMSNGHRPLPPFSNGSGRASSG